MIVTCENCGSSFNLKDSLVKPNGRKVRCSKCKTVFFVPPPAEESDDEDALDLTLLEADDPSSSEDKTASEEESSSSPSKEIQLSLDDTEDFDFSKDDDRTTPPDKSEDGSSSENSLDNLDLKLELDLDSDEPAPPQPAENQKVDENTLDDLDLELELDLDDFDNTDTTGESDEAGESEESEDFDLSDIDELLKIDSDEKESSSRADEADGLELELDLDTGILDDKESDNQGNTTDTQDDFDFSKIEALLELDEESPAQETEKTSARKQDSEEEFKLDFELDSEEPAKQESAEDNDEIEFDFDIEIENEDDNDAVEDAAVKSEEDTIESIIQANLDEPGKQDEREASFEPALNTDDTSFQDQTTPVSAKKRILTTIAASLVLILLGGGGYFLFRGVVNGDIQLPFISPEAQSAAADDQGDKIIPLNDTIGYDFVQNTKAGNLLVITGKVQNTSSTPQRFIKVTGTLITQGGNKSNITKTVYCGNIFSDIELTHTDISELNKRLLKNQAGNNQSNTRIDPGEKIPFMIVFSNLPDNLETFELKVADYLPAEG